MERCEAPLPGPLRNWAPLEQEELRLELSQKKRAARKEPPSRGRLPQVWLCWRVLRPATSLLQAPREKDLVPEPLRRLGPSVLSSVQRSMLRVLLLHLGAPSQSQPWGLLVLQLRPRGPSPKMAPQRMAEKREKAQPPTRQPVRLLVCSRVFPY